MSEMIERVAKAARETAQSMGSYFDDYVAAEVARAAIEAMRNEFEVLASAYSPQGDDTVWIDDRTPIGQYIDSIINRVYA